VHQTFQIFIIQASFYDLKVALSVEILIKISTFQSGIRLLMDPKTGRILGTLNGQNQPPPPLRAAPGLAVRMPGHLAFANLDGS